MYRLTFPIIALEDLDGLNHSILADLSLSSSMFEIFIFWTRHGLITF